MMKCDRCHRTVKAVFDLLRTYVCEECLRGLLLFTDTVPPSQEVGRKALERAWEENRKRPEY